MKTIKLGIQRGDRTYKYPTTIDHKDGRIWFVESSFDLKDEIKALKGARWHGMDEDPVKQWSVLDCERNKFQLEYMQGNNPYEWWDRPLIKHEYSRPLRSHQRDMADQMLTFHYGILAAEMGLGKTLAAIEIMEQSDTKHWWWVGPKSAIAAVEIEFKKWGCKVPVQMMTYEGLTKLMKTWKSGDPAPRGVVFDESSRLKSSRAQRTQAAQALADAIREEHGTDGFVVLMSGTPSPKSPLDWWSQCEVAWPGFLREGSLKSFEWRMGLYEKKKKPDGFFWDRVTWLDDERKCANCGKYPDLCKCGNYQKSINEVAYLDERLRGLAFSYLKKDCLDLPEKVYREYRCEPTRTIKRVADTMSEIAPTAIQALTWLRELSDGFQYTEVETGEKSCDCTGRHGDAGPAVPDPDCDMCEGSGAVPVFERQVRQIPCPKDQIVKDLLDECEDHGRMIIFAGFKGSIDRLRVLCLEQKWDVIQVDGRGWKVHDHETGKFKRAEKGVCKPLEYWSSDAARVVFLAHPQSGGMGLTLTESRMSVFYSNDFNPESRSQAEDRHHRMGMDSNLGGIIVDIYHLPTDEHVRNVLKENRRLELLTLGEVQGSLK